MNTSINTNAPQKNSPHNLPVHTAYNHSNDNKKETGGKILISTARTIALAVLFLSSLTSLAHASVVTGTLMAGSAASGADAGGTLSAGVGNTLVGTVVGGSGSSGTNNTTSNTASSVSSASGGYYGIESGGDEPMSDIPFANSVPGGIASGGLSSGGSCNLLTADLSYGSPLNDSSQVTELQTMLNAVDAENLAVTGVFDTATQAAVERFQARHSAEILAPWGLMVPTGIVSVTTRSVLNNLYCGASTALTPSEALYIAYHQSAGTGASGNSAQNTVAVASIASNPSTETTLVPAANAATINNGADQAPGVPNTGSLGTSGSSDNTAAAMNASGGFWGSIVDFFKNLFRM